MINAIFKNFKKVNLKEYRDDTFPYFFSYAIYLLVTSYLTFLISSFLYSTSSISTIFLVFIEVVSMALFAISLILFLIGAGLYTFSEIGRAKALIANLREEMVFLELINHKSVFESLSEMSRVFETLISGGGEGQWFDVWWSGKKRPKYSFEIFSDGKEVSFYAVVPRKTRDIVVSAFVSNYSYIDIRDVKDYTYDFFYDKEKISTFPVEFNLANGNGLPIKTFKEFGITEGIGETNRWKQDPTSILFETFSSIEQGERMWIQFVFRGQKEARPRYGISDNPFKKEFWQKKLILRDELQEARKDIFKNLAKRFDMKTGGGELSKGDKDELLSLKGEQLMGEKTITKNEERIVQLTSEMLEHSGVEVGIRAIYIAEKDKFDGKKIDPFLSSFKLLKTESNSVSFYGAVLDDVSDVSSKLEPKERPDQDREKEVMLQLYRDRMFWLAPALYRQTKEDIKMFNRLAPPTKRRRTIVVAPSTLATMCHLPMEMTGMVSNKIKRHADRAGYVPEEVYTKKVN